MGAEQSSSRSGTKAPNQTSKTCYYEVLGIERLATDDEVKKAYRRKALELHPDRNYGDVENATIKFAEVQSAYQVLSDSQERAWYDSHRDSILQGDSAGPSDEDQFEHNVDLTSAKDIVGLIGRFSPRMPFTDSADGFYGILQDTFAKLAAEENSACDWEGLERNEYPEFGHSRDSYEGVVRPFYRVWISFSTKKTFSWRDAYKTSDAPDRATRRLIDKENKRLRDEGIREFNDAVRALVAFVRKRDPRFVPNTQSDADRQKALRDAAAAQAARSRAANLAKLNEHVIPDWARTNSPDTEGDFSDSSESEVEEIECVVCGKIFKSEKQYETHERSKKHIKAVQQLQREMRKENKLLNLGAYSEEGSSAITEELQELELVQTEVDNADAPSITDEVVDPIETAEAIKPPVEKGSGEKSSTESTLDIAGDTTFSEAKEIEIDDDYAPREEIENRLTSTLLGIATTGVSEGSAPTPHISLGDDSTNLPKLGKAKAKRAKKAARQETDSQANYEFQCAACNKAFSSNTKLFVHIKELDHAQPVAKGSKGKNNKKR